MSATPVRYVKPGSRAITDASHGNVEGRERFRFSATYTGEALTLEGTGGIMRTALTSVLLGLLALTACSATEPPRGETQDGGGQASQAQTVQDLLGQTYDVTTYAGADEGVTLIGPVTIDFAEDAWSVSTPCDSHGGSGVTYTDANINVTENWLTAIGCPEDLARQSNFITEVFAGDPAWHISGEVLTLTTGKMTIVAIRTPSSPANSTSMGRLEGRVLLNGGPLNPDTGNQALDGSPATAHTVTISSEQTGARYVAMSDVTGRFSVRLPAGVYVLDCESEPRVEVEPGAVISQDCAIPVP